MALLLSDMHSDIDAKNAVIYLHVQSRNTSSASLGVLGIATVKSQLKLF